MCVAVTKAPFVGGLPAGHTAQQALFKQWIRDKDPNFDVSSIVTPITVSYDLSTGRLTLNW
jgi:hypothetical protein